MISHATILTADVDKVFVIIFSITITLLLLVTSFVLYFVIRYNRKRHPNPVQVRETPVVEALFLGVPTIIVLWIFYLGMITYRQERTVPADAMVVNVFARQWSWMFQYDNGIQSDTLKLPVGRPAKMLLNSLDVIHGFFVPAFRIKEDVVPGKQNYVWFQPMTVGTYDIFCTQYCGLRHSYMYSTVEVLSVEEFNSWYAGRGAAPAGAPKAEAVAAIHPGLQVIRVKGCLACHSTDGSPLIGPTYKGLFGKKGIVITPEGEREAVVDEAFIWTKVIDPGRERVKGFPPIMPSFKGQLSDDEIEEIIEYLKGLK